MPHVVMGPRSTLGIVGAVLLIADLTSTHAYAQEPKRVAAIGGLEEIIVTARKRAENLQEVPVAITAITSEELREKSIINPQDLKNHTPGLEVRTTGLQRASVQYFIRGQGETFSSPPSVVTYFSEAPAQNVSTTVSIGNNGQFFDIANIQVLKGPQGTLFGRSTTGGAVLITPQHPTNEFEGFVEASRGNYDYGKYTGVLNVPLVDGILSARLAANVLRREGFTESLTTGQKLDNWHRETYRLGLSFTPTSWLDSYLMFQDNRVNENNTGNVLLAFNAAGANQPTSLMNPAGAGAFVASQVCGGLFPTNPAAAGACTAQRIGILTSLRDGLNAELARVQNGGDDAKRHNVTGAELILRGRTEQLLNITSLKPGKMGFLGDVTFKNVFSTIRTLGVVSRYDGGASANGNGHGLVYNNYDFLNFQPVYTDRSRGRNQWLDDFSEEFQIQGAIDKHSWIVGYYLEESKHDRTQPPLFAAFGNAFNPFLQPNVVTDFTVDRLELQRGMFGQFTLDLSDWVLNGLKFTGGYRWSWSHQRLTHYSMDQLAYFTQGNLNPGAILPAARQTPTVNEQSPSWNVSIDYQITPDMLVYIAHRRGFKPGGSNVSPQTAVANYRPTYDPETVKDAELGIKADWLIADHALRTNAAVYKMWYSNIQRSETFAQNNGVPYTQTNNIAKAQIEGLELSTIFEATRSLEISLTYSFINPYYVSWPGTVRNVITGQLLPYASSPYIGTPKHQGTLGIRYTLPVSESLGKMSAYAEYYRQSSDHLNDTELADNGIGLQKGYGDLNLRFDWANFLGQPFDLGLFVRNATDEIHAQSIGSFYGVGLNTISAIYNEPRMYGAELRWRFGAQANR